MLIEYKGRKPKIHPTAFIAPTAILIGDVEVGAHSSVWFGAVVRGDLDKVRIGRYTNIQDNCAIHVEEDPQNRYGVEIGDYVTIGHGALIHGCRIEDVVLIGAKAVVFNGVTVRKGAVVGMGAIIPSGKKVEMRTLVVGIPAREKRVLSEDEVKENKTHAIKYSELAAEYKKILNL